MKAFDKIAAGLKDAIAIAQPARLHVPAELDVKEACSMTTKLPDWSEKEQREKLAESRRQGISTISTIETIQDAARYYGETLTSFILGGGSDDEIDDFIEQAKWLRKAYIPARDKFIEDTKTLISAGLTNMKAN